MGPRDPAMVRHGADIRTAVDRELQQGVPAGANLVEALGAQRTQAIYDHRNDVITGLVQDAAALADGRELLLMATDDLQVTGPDVGVGLASFGSRAAVREVV